MKSTFKLGAAEHAIELSRAAHGYRLHLGDQVIPFEMESCGAHRARLRIAGHTHDLRLITAGDDVFIQLDGEAHALRYVDPLAHFEATARGGAADTIRAPMPGSIVAVAVQEGEAVTRGQALLVMESMKMETTITAPRDGVIATVAYEKGQTFERDALLVALQPAADAEGGAA
ncbi:MAG: biotin/lipoyl-binding protein [Nevskiaceae bacterium]|nr:MAG: biotin/lipoyl-binding protein [Nevskiaceae bacterium]TBR72533.1 MAG: biotin/lipoyl-binding protein [Nevskiaceae bacterium]